MLPAAVPKELKTTAQLLLLCQQCCWFLVTPPEGLRLLAKISLRGSDARIVKMSSCPVTALQTVCSELLKGGGDMDQTSHTRFLHLKDINQKWKNLQQESWALKDYHHYYSFLCLTPSSLKRPKAWAVSKKVGGHSSHCIQSWGICALLVGWEKLPHGNSNIAYLVLDMEISQVQNLQKFQG